MPKHNKLLTRRLEMQWYIENPHIHKYSESKQKAMRRKLREQLEGNGPKVFLEPMPNICHLLRDIRRNFLKCLTLCNQMMVGVSHTDVNESKTLCEQWIGMQESNSDDNETDYGQTDNGATNAFEADAQNSGPSKTVLETNIQITTTGMIGSPVLHDKKKMDIVRKQSKPSNVNKVQTEIVKKRRGRKLGSKNKPKNIIANYVENISNIVEPTPSAVTPAASTTSQQMVTSTTIEQLDQPLTHYLDNNVGIFSEDRQNLLFQYVDNSHVTSNEMNHIFNDNNYNNTNVIQTFPAISKNTVTGCLTIEHVPSVFITPVQSVPPRELVRLTDSTLMVDARLSTPTKNINYFNVPLQSTCNGNDANNYQPVDLSSKNIADQHAMSLQCNEPQALVIINNNCKPSNYFQVSDIDTYTISDVETLCDSNNVTESLLMEGTSVITTSISQDTNSFPPILVVNGVNQCRSNKTTPVILSSKSLKCDNIHNTNKHTCQLSDVEDNMQTQFNENYTIASVNAFETDNAHNPDLQMPKLTNIQTNSNVTKYGYNVESWRTQDAAGTDSSSDVSSIYICEVISDGGVGSNGSFENVSNDWERIYSYFDRGDSDENNNEEYYNVIVAETDDSSENTESAINIAKNRNKSTDHQLACNRKKDNSLDLASPNVEKSLTKAIEKFKNDNESLILDDTLTLFELESNLNDTLDFTENLEDAISLSASSMGSVCSHWIFTNKSIIEEFNEEVIKTKANTNTLGSNTMDVQQSTNIENKHQKQNKKILKKYKIPKLVENPTNKCTIMEINVSTNESFIASDVNLNDSILGRCDIPEISSVFGVTCLPYIVDSCNSLEKCTLLHTLRDAADVLKELAQLPAWQLQSAYRFMLNHEKLFHSYFKSFCNFYASNNQHEKLLNMVCDCVLYPDGAIFLQTIFICLQKCDFSEIEACRHILDRCQSQHSIFIDALVCIIMDTDWTVFLDYLESYAASGTYKFNIDVLRIMAPIVLRTLNVRLAKVLFNCLLALNPEQIVIVKDCAELTQCLELIKSNTVV